jgi:hypothetical protein
MRKPGFACAILYTAGVISACADSIHSYPVDISGHVSYQAGQVVHGWDGQGESSNNLLDYDWVQNAFASLSIHAPARSWLHIYSTIESELWYSIFRRSENFSTHRTLYATRIKQAEGVIHGAAPGIDSFELGIGQFEHKYNRDARRPERN